MTRTETLPTSNPAASGGPGGVLSAVDHATFETEAKRWKYAGAKEQHVREQFGESLARYYQRLNALLDSAAAEAAYPALVRRLRRLREQRHHARVLGGAGAQERAQSGAQLGVQASRS